jgi:hypothetical protein
MARGLALIGVIWLGTGPILAGSAPALGGDTFDDALPGLVIGARHDEPCPADSITGQIPSQCGSTQWYFYSDLEFYSGTLSRRVACENFPKTGVLNPADPNQWIGTIIWYGVNIDVNSNGCSKGTPGAYQFRIRFYNDNAGAPDPSFVYQEVVTPAMVDTGETVLYGTIPAIRWMYTAVLTTPRQMANGWFSICGQGSPNCYSLWEGSGSDGGDNKIYRWWEVGGTIPGDPVTTYCDLSYCFGPKQIGACCDDRTSTCTDNVLQVACAAIGGRFRRDQPCSSFGSDPNDPNDYACGLAPGACCHNDGVCEITTYLDCSGNGNPCYPCIGDLNCDCDRDADDVYCLWNWCDPQECIRNWDCNGDGVYNFDDLPCLMDILMDPANWGPCGSCRGDCDCSGSVGFDDINPFVLALSDPVAYHAAYPNCDIRNADCNGDGVANFDDISPFVDRLGVVCPLAGTRSNLWLGPCSSCDDCCPLDCSDPNYGVTHPELEPCGQDTNGGCGSHLDPNDPNSPPDPNAWEHLGTLDPNHPTVICGTLWVDHGTRDIDWYDFQLPTQGSLSWEMETDLIPFISTPVFGDANHATTPNCDGSLWGYWNTAPALMCIPSGNSPSEVFPGGITYWWIVFPDSGGGTFYGYPCSSGWNDYLLTITTAPLVCDPCLQTDIPESEAACGPGYTDTFNSGCDAAAGFPVQPQIDPNTWYCGKSGTWTDPNGNAQVDYDWWKIVLSGTVRKRLQIQMRSAFNMRWELYSVPGDVCANKVRLDYYEFGVCESNVTIYTACLQPNNSVYYMRIVPTGAVDCTQWNHYRFQYAVVNEAPACTTCSVICTTSPDDACQSGPNDPETNAGCNAADPNNPANYMYFTPGNNVFGPKYCGRLATFTAADGGAAVDSDWFRYTQLASRTKLVIRGKAMFRMSINIGSGCDDPNNRTHGWDRPCKGTTTAATQTWLTLTPGTLYTGVIIYGNGGGDGTGEQDLKQFFFGLPCSENRNNYELELQAQT